MDKLKELSSIILEWIGVTLPKLKNNLKEDGDLREILENGTILCRLMRKVKSGWIKKYHKHAKIGTYFADGTLSYKSLSLSLSFFSLVFKRTLDTRAHTDNISMFLHACKEHLSMSSDFMFNATYLHSGATIEELNCVCCCLVEVCCRMYLYYNIPPTDRMRQLHDFYTIKKNVVKSLKKQKKRGSVKPKDLVDIMRRASTIVSSDEKEENVISTTAEKRTSRQLMDEFIKQRNSQNLPPGVVMNPDNLEQEECKEEENRSSTSSSRLSDIPVPIHSTNSIPLSSSGTQTSERLHVISDVMHEIDKVDTREMLGDLGKVLSIDTSTKEKEDMTTPRPDNSPHKPSAPHRDFTVYTEPKPEFMEEHKSEQELLRERQKVNFVKSHDSKEEHIKFVGWVYKQGAKSLFGIKMVCAFSVTDSLSLFLTHSLTHCCS